MIGADEEFLALFKMESDERLQNLDTGLLRLEDEPADAQTVDALFREAHNLKGAARMLGAAEVASVMHRFEDILGAARRGQEPLTPVVIERLYRALDAVRRLVQEALSGAAAGFDAKAVIAWLGGEGPIPGAGFPPPTPDSAPGSAETAADAAGGEEPAGALLPVPHAELGPHSGGGPSAIAPAPDAALAADEPPARSESPAPLPPSGGYRIETIRVEPEKLDALMTHAGELSVTRIRIARRVGQVAELISLYEEWSREGTVCRFATRSTGLDPGQALSVFFQRSESRLERLRVLLEGLQAAAYDDHARLDLVSDQLEEGIRRIRLLPLSTIFQLFPRMVRDLAREQGKQVQLLIEGGDTAADKRIIEDMKDPLMHMLRNAVDHGLESPAERSARGKPPLATLRLSARQEAGMVLIEVSDDGRGIDLEGVRRAALRKGLRREEELAAMTPNQIQALIFAPGFSTRATVTDVSGRGVGMDVVRENVERLKGSLELDSRPGAGCTLRVRLPVTLATAHVLIAEVGRRAYAFPVEAVETTRLVSPDEIFTLEGSDTIVYDDTPLTVARLSTLLELPTRPEESPASSPLALSGGRSGPAPLACVVVRQGAERVGLLVDALLDEQEIVLKPLGGLLRRVRNVAGAAILGTGDICIVLNPGDLLLTVQRRAAAATGARPRVEAVRPRRVLLVEDSITTRTQEKRILESAGYEVVVAVDGVDGFNKLVADTFDAVVSDVEMPNMDGLTLTAKIREQSRFRDLPVVLVTTLSSDEDRKRGLEAGASGYIPKPSFSQQVLVETLGRLI